MSDTNKELDLDLSSFLQSDKVEETPAVDEKSPLEKMKEYKEKNPGLIVNNADVTYDDKPRELKSSIDNERREEDFNNYISEIDDLAKTAQDLRLIRQPTNALEEAAMIDELDRRARMKTNKLPSDPKFQDGTVRQLTEDERLGTDMGIPMEQKSTFFVEKGSEEEKALLASSNETTSEATETTDSADAGSEKTEKDEEREKLVQVLIDKTGFGLNEIAFTDEERAKMTVATEIRLTEVQSLELDTADFIAPDVSFVDKMNNTTREIGTCVVPLVASGYRATMKGLSYGQISDLYLNSEQPPYEQMNKKCSIVYSNIVDTTIGKFESYEEFLKNTAFIDIDTMLYGMMVCTYPEVDEVGMSCKQCGSQFNQKYFTRDLMDLKHSSTEYLQRLEKLMNVPADKFTEYHLNSPVMKHKLVKLPESKIVVEVGLISAYENLYKLSTNIDPDKYREAHPEDTGGAMLMTIGLFSVAQSFAIPNDDGKYVRYTDFEDMLQIGYRLPMNDYQLLINLVSNTTGNYAVTFSISNTVCPKCKHTSEYIEVEIEDLVFTKYQQLMSTEIAPGNILDL